MSARRKDILEIMRQKSSMSQKVVIKQGNEAFALYAGGNPDIGFRMAKLDIFIESGFIPKDLLPFVKLYRKLLNQQRMAWFATTGSEITMLGFLLGLKSDRISAT